MPDNNKKDKGLPKTVVIDNTKNNTKVPTKYTLTYSQEFNPNNVETMASFGEQGVIQSAFGNTDYGDSKYDKILSWDAEVDNTN